MIFNRRSASSSVGRRRAFLVGYPRSVQALKRSADAQVQQAVREAIAQRLEQSHLRSQEISKYASVLRALGKQIEAGQRSGRQPLQPCR